MGEESALKYIRKNLETTVKEIIDKTIDANLPIQTITSPNTVEALLRTNEITSLKTNIFENFELIESTDDIGADINFTLEYENLLERIIESKCVSTVLRGIEKLLTVSVTDIYERKKFPLLMKVVRENMLIKNNELFTVCYKLHIKLVSYPTTMTIGYFSLSKFLNNIFTSKKIYYTQRDINLKYVMQEKIMKLVNLLLIALKNIFNQNKNYKEKKYVAIMKNFLELISFHANQNSKYDKAYIFNYVSLLDPKGMFFRRMTHNLYHRNIVFEFMKSNPNFLQYIVNEVFAQIFEFRKEFNLQTQIKDEINEETIKFASSVLSTNMLSLILSRKQFIVLFPAKVVQHFEPMNADMIIVTLIRIIYNRIKINSQIKCKPPLTKLIKNVLTKNHSLLNTYVINELLLNVYMDNITPEYLERVLFIVQIVNSFIKMPYGLYLLIGYSDFIKRPSKNLLKYFDSSIISFIENLHNNTEITFLKFILHLTTSMCKYYIDNFDPPQYKVYLMTELLTCYYNIVNMHPMMLYMIDFRESLKIIKKTFEKFCRFKGNIGYILMPYVNILGLSYNMWLDSTEDDSFYPLTKMYVQVPYFWKTKEKLNFFIFAPFNRYGRKALEESNEYLIEKHLVEIWDTAENEILFLSGSDRILTELIDDFLRIIFTLHFITRGALMLLRMENDRITDDPATLDELIKYALSGYDCGSAQCILGTKSLQLLVNNLNLYLFLEYKYNLKELLLELQEDSLVNDIEPLTIILDECSIARREIINYTTNMGVIISESNVQTVKSKKKLSELQVFLNNTRDLLHDNMWLMQLKNMFRNLDENSLKQASIADLLCQAKSAYPINNKFNLGWPSSDSTFTDLFPEEEIALALIVDFGLQNNLLQEVHPNGHWLRQLLKEVKLFVRDEETEYSHFDWFVAIIFLICNGNIEKSRNILQGIPQYPNHAFMWPALCNGLKFQANLDNLLHKITDIEVILCVFRKSGISWSAIFYNWVQQCFFNVLEWNQIYHYLIFCVLYPPEYVLFLVISMIKYHENNILKLVINQDLEIYRRIIDMQDFNIKDWIPFIENLSKQYKNLSVNF